LPSIEIPAVFGTVTLAVSKASFMPAGGVHVAELEKSCDVTSIAFATVVVTLGVVWVSPFAVFCPASTLIGAAVSTFENVWMPPAEPVEVEKVHV